MSDSFDSILVTGASGFVGKALCLELAKRGIFVLAVKLSQTNPENLTFVLKECKAVVHLAARVHVMHEATRNALGEYRRTNVDTTLDLARQAAALGVKRFVFVSSIKVNGEFTSIGHSFSEDDVPAPQDPYGISKMEAEQGLRQIAKETGMEVVIIRPPLVYGSGVKANFAALIRAVQRGWPLPLGAVHNQRSLVGLDNLVDLIIMCTINPAAANQTFLISDGLDISTPELIREIAKASGVKARLVSVPMPLLHLAGKMFGMTDTMNRLCGNLQVDITKARNLLHWRPPVSFNEGISKAFNDSSLS